MKKLRWQLLIIFLTGLVVGVLLLWEQPKTLKPINEAATPEPVKGGIYTEALVGALQRLNPLLDYYNPVDRDIDRLIYSGLIRFDSQGAPQPELAESWGYSQDGTLYNFTLRQGLTWHDGRPLTAEDVIFTVGLLRNAESYLPKDMQEFWKDIEVNKLSDTTLQFRLPEAYAPFLDYLSFGILPQHLYSGKTIKEIVDSPQNMQPIGSGPYRFNRFLVENDKIVGVSLTANPAYYRQKPYLDEMVFRFYPDGPAALRAYQQGQVQGISQVSSEILDGALAEKNLAFYTGRRPEISLVLFNLKNADVAFLQDVKVRRALMAGLNRQWLLDRILQGQAVLADGPIFPGTWAYYPPSEKIVFDPEVAKNLLKEAGFVASEQDVVRKKDTVVLAIRLVHPNDETHRLIAESIQRNWQAIGVQVELEALPYPQLIQERLEQRTYQVALVDLNLSRLPDPDPYPFWDQAQVTGGQNYTQWDNRIVSEYLEQARVTVNQADRAKLYRNFQVIFRQEWPALPLYYPVYSYAVDRQVLGIRVGPLFDSADRFATIEEWSLARPVVKETPKPSQTP